MKHNLAFAALCTVLTSTLAAQAVADYSFDGDDLTTPQPAFATISDLTISNTFMFGGSAPDRWLCLTTDWNNTGGTITFTVTPNPGESVSYDELSWNAVTNNPSSADSVRAVTVKADSQTLAVIDPLTHNTLHQIDLTGFPFLQSNPNPVVFELDFVGNPGGQSSYEVSGLALSGGPCTPALTGVSPSSLPSITNDCFILTGDCFDEILGVKFDGNTIAGGFGPYPGNYGQPFYTIMSPTQLKVCHPFCIADGTYEIRVIWANQELMTNVSITTPTQPTTVCAPVHHITDPLCVFISSGPLQGPNNMFLGLSSSNLPSVLPGFLNMAIGDNFTSALCVNAPPGECVKVTLGMLPGNMVGTTLYFQSIAWNFSNTILPLPVTDVCTMSIVP